MKSHINVYFDDSIKLVDKGLTQSLKKYFSNANELKQIVPKLPTIIFIGTINEKLALNDSLQDSNNTVICLEDSNLEMTFDSVVIPDENIKSFPLDTSVEEVVGVAKYDHLEKLNKVYENFKVSAKENIQEIKQFMKKEDVEELKVSPTFFDKELFNFDQFETFANYLFKTNIAIFETDVRLAQINDSLSCFYNGWACLPVDSSGKWYLLVDNFNNISKKSKMYLSQFCAYIFNISRIWELTNESHGVDLESIEMPVAVFNQDQLFITGNKEFLQLGIKIDDFKTIDSGGLILNNLIYHVSQIQSGDNIIFLFKKDESQQVLKDSHGKEELGIITGSLAHELNNPIAGILAALSVLMLSDDISSEALEQIDSMKRSVKRCKLLIETFLGFSKTQINHEHNLENIAQLSFDQAIQLLRFRLVEQNIKLSLNYKTVETFNSLKNISVLTMTFYLIFNEYLTELHHLNLVSGDNNRTLVGEINEKQSQIVLKLEKLEEMNSEKIVNALLRNIASLSEINIEIKQNRLILKRL